MRHVRFWIPVVLYAGLIFWLSSVPGNQFPKLPFALDFLPVWIAQNPDKIVHAGLYAILGWLCLRAIARGTSIRFPHAAILAFLIASAYGATDEWHQRFVPNRTCDLYDWIADSIGCLLAILVLYRFYSRRSHAHP